MLHAMQVNVFFLASSLFKVYQERQRQVKLTAKEQSRLEVARYELSAVQLLICHNMFGLSTYVLYMWCEASGHLTP